MPSVRLNGLCIEIDDGRILRKCLGLLAIAGIAGSISAQSSAGANASIKLSLADIGKEIHLIQRLKYICHIFFVLFKIIFDQK